MKPRHAMLVLAAGVLALASAAPSRARDDKPAGNEDHVAAVLKAMQGADWKAFSQASAALQQRLQKGGADGEAAAQALLARKADIVAEPGVHKQLDDLIGRKKPALAAEWLLAIAKARQTVTQYKKGHVAVGRVAVEDQKLDTEFVLAQMPILAEGYFAGEVGDLERPLHFRAAGYADLVVPLKGKAGPVVDLGTVMLKTLAKDQAGALKGKIALDDPKGGTPTVRLSLMVPPANTPHNGYSPRRRWPKDVEVSVGKDGEFAAAGLTPADYYVTIEAGGHTTTNQRMKVPAGGVKDAGAISLRSDNLGFYIGKPAPKAGEIAWEKDFSSAIKKAKEEKRPVMVMMTATWCGPCKMLEKNTLSDPWVRHFLSDFVLVKAYEDREVEKTYGLQGYPTLVFTDSEGKAAFKTVGYKPTLPFVAECVKAHGKLGRKLPAELQALVEKKLFP